MFLIALLAAPLCGQNASDHRAAAERGDKTAQYNLGVCYTNGWGVTQDHKQSVHWYTKAANQGLAEAQHNLGVCYYKGDGVTKDYKQAVYWYTKAANQGYALAQYNLGVCYEQGKGVAQDYKQAVYWFTKAANQGYAAAQYKLGRRYYYGEGVEKNEAQADYWYRKAADQGHADAQWCLGSRYHIDYLTTKSSSDRDKAEYWFKKALEKRSELSNLWASFAEACLETYANDKAKNQGSNTNTTSSTTTPAAKPQVAAAELVTQAKNYHYGRNGVAKNLQKAAELYTQAANMGDAEAQHELGNCYALGYGVAKDYKQAVHWYTQAANQGYAAAQYMLGEGYNNGSIVAQNKARALEWHKRAANQGYPLSQYKLANQYYRGEGTFQSYKLALHWYKKAWTRKELFDEQERYTMEVRMKECEEKVEQARPSSSATTSSSTTSPRSPVSTSTSTPSYSYSGSSSSTGSSKYGRWPWYYDGVDYGVHFAYIQRAIHARDAVSGETGYADVFGEEGWSKGFQVGMHFNPLDDKEILAMNSGFYLEMLFDKWENAPSGYYDNYYEFNLHVPLEMVLYLPFGRESALHLRAGLGADFSCLAKVTDWDDSYMPSQEVDYGEGFINRFNLSLNLGVSFRFEGVMLHATYQKGLLGHPFSQGYRCTLDKLSLGLSFVVDD